MAAVVQGGLCAAVAFLDFLTPPVSVEQPTDEDGTYLEYFLVHLASGTVLRVTVEVESD